MSAIGLLTSQIGYDTGHPIRAVVRGPAGMLSGQAFINIHNQREKTVARASLQLWGERWGSHWWLADLSALGKGTYDARVFDGPHPTDLKEFVEVAPNALWDRTILYAGVDQAERRARLALNRVGWQDCGASWQEANSHAAYVIGFCDLLDRAGGRLTDEHRNRAAKQIINGCDYLALLQDRAGELRLGEGAVSHQKPKFEEISLPSDVAKASFAWARAARALPATEAIKAKEYLTRAVRAFVWLSSAKPFGANGFSHYNHGAPKGFRPPDEWMTRDLLTFARAAVALAESGLTEYWPVAVGLVKKVLARQVPPDRAQHGLSGHFYTFDAPGLTEKAWIHHIEAGVIGCDAGGHYPNDLFPILTLLTRFPRHDDATRWRDSIRSFAYDYLLPACRLSPFLILPQGYFEGQGWLHFAGLWHGMNAAYAQTAALAFELAKHFADPAFDEIATGNLQWIAGLNAGLTAESLSASHMFSADVPIGTALPVSMICGVGRRWAGTWLNVRGSICNGFSTGDQFKFDVEPDLANDGPFTFTDEDWITHAGAWLTAISHSSVT